MILTPRPGQERLSPHDVVRQSELGADRPGDLVLEQQRSGSTRSDSMSSGDRRVVVTLDVGAVLATGLHDVGIQRSPARGNRASVYRPRPARTCDEQLADRLALVLGIDDVPERVEELVRGPLVDEIDSPVSAQGTCRTTCSPSPSRIRPVSTNTQVAAGVDRPVHDPRRRRQESTPARQPADDPVTTDLLPHGRRLRRRSPTRSSTPAGGPPRSRKRSLTASPRWVWLTSGWNCTPNMAQAGLLDGATRRRPRSRSHGEALAGPRRSSRSGSSTRSARPPLTGTASRRPDAVPVRPYSPRPGLTPPPSCCAISWAP